MQDAGLQVDARPWQSDVDADRPALIFPLAAWDYTDHPDDFRRWIDQVTLSGGVFANDPRLMLWNMDKGYLADLAALGVAVPPTFRIEDRAQVRAVMREHRWGQAVIKPAIGQSGNGVCLLQEGRPLPDFEGPQILQPWLPEIRQGELSMVFIAGVYSHAVRRLPAAGDWRANSQYGVQVTPANAPAAAIMAGADCLGRLPQMPFYARVDGLMIGNGFLLTELELIEPALFWDIVPGSAARFARAVLDRLQRRESEASETPSTDISTSAATGIRTASGARST